MKKKDIIKINCNNKVKIKNSSIKTKDNRITNNDKSKLKVREL